VTAITQEIALIFHLRAGVLKLMLLFNVRIRHRTNMGVLVGAWALGRLPLNHPSMIRRVLRYAGDRITYGICWQPVELVVLASDYSSEVMAPHHKRSFSVCHQPVQTAFTSCLRADRPFIRRGASKIEFAMNARCRECEAIALEYKKACLDFWQNASEETREAWRVLRRLAGGTEDDVSRLEDLPRPKITGSPRIAEVLARRSEHWSLTFHSLTG
jgi:hypothetical protein